MIATVFDKISELVYSTEPKIDFDGVIINIYWDDKQSEYSIILNANDLTDLFKQVIDARFEQNI